MRRSRAELSMPKSARNWRASSSESWRISLSSRADRPMTAVFSRPAQGAKGARTSISRRMSSSSRLTATMSGFWVRKPEAPQKDLLVGLELGPPKRRLGFQEALALFQGGQLADVAVALLGRDLLDQPLDPAFDDGQIAEQEFGLESAQVADGIDGYRADAERRDRGKPGRRPAGRPPAAACPGTARKSRFFGLARRQSRPAP